MQQYGYYLGWGSDRMNPDLNEYNVLKYKLSRNPTYAKASLSMRMKTDSFVACVANKSYVGKNRARPDDGIFELPYRTNSTTKTVTIHPYAKPEAHKCLVSWILENSIDLNHIDEVDEFTLLMLAE